MKAAKHVMLVLFLSISGIIFAQNETAFNAYDIFRMDLVVETAVSPDGKQVAYTVNVERPFAEGKGPDYRELYVLDVNSGNSRALLEGENRVWSLSWTSGGDRITFLADLEGERKTQLYAIPASGGEAAKLFTSEKSILRYAWNPNGNNVAFISRTSGDEAEDTLSQYGFDAEVFEENIPFRSIFLYNLETNITSQLTDENAVFDMAWSPSGNRILAQIAPQDLVDDSYMFKRLYLINPNTGKTDKLVENPGKLTSMAWSPDGKHIAFVSAADINDPVSGSLFIVPAVPGQDFSQIRNYTQDFEGSVETVEWRNNNTVLFSATESVDVTLSEFKIDGKERKLLLEGGEVVFSGFSASGNTVSFGGNTATNPSDVYVFDLRREELKKMTDLNPWVANKKLGRQEKISYEARDGLRIDGVLVYPADYQPGQRYPLIVYVHGGPESAVHNGWSTYYSMWGQMAANQGYFVFMPNYRASSGRGVEFAKMDQRDLGGAEFDDVLDGIDYLADQRFIDPEKVGIGGGSYGGYFSAWAATKHSEHFAAAVAFVGISNQISKRNTTDIPYEDYHVHWRIWTNEDPELIYDRSPVKWVENNVTPTLVLHGKEDPRVHPSQSLELYRALKLQGNAPVRLIWYPGEGHGNANNPARLDYALRTMDWFNYYIKDQGPQDELPAGDIDVDARELRAIDATIEEKLAD